MRNLKANGIDWYACDRKFVVDDKLVINFEDNKQINEWLKEINSWQSDNISKYINDKKIGKYLREVAANDESLYFGFDGGKLATIAMIEGQKQMFEFVEFTNYIAECKSLAVDCKPNYLNLYQAMRALINTTNENNSTIKYLVVNPSMQNKGIGTRSVKSIIDNISYFSGSEDNNVTQALIHYQNEASQRIFRKNDFYPVCMASQNNLAKQEDDIRVVTTVYDNYYHVY